MVTKNRYYFRLIITVIFLTSFVLMPVWVDAGNEEKNTLIHIKTSLKRDDAQICVAYNVIWAALESGMKVNVLIDADAVNTFKVGWRGKDDIEGYKLPANLRSRLAEEFGLSLESIPKNYGEYLHLLRDKGARFYINGEMLLVAGISKQFGDLEKISAKFFKPVTLKEMFTLMTGADYYLVY
ncbi:MAG: hypothetical protein JRI22_16895 [Deltaproteobacteria bacterium]|nr:hypothetical protein [Deltaproteobacteria bacterium]